MQNVKQVAADVMKVVSDTQEKIVDMPAMATGALAKLMAALKGGDGPRPDSDDTASGEKDADAGAPQVVTASTARSATAAAATAGGSTSAASATKGPSAQTPAMSDQVVLRSGTTIRGHVIKQTPGTFVTIETPDGTQRTIAWDRVSEVVVGPPVKAK